MIISSVINTNTVKVFIDFKKETNQQPVFGASIRYYRVEGLKAKNISNSRGLIIVKTHEWNQTYPQNTVTFTKEVFRDKCAAV